MKLNNDGYVVVWLLIIFGAIAVGFYALTAPRSTLSYSIYVASALFLCGGLWFEARRDIHAFAQVTFVIAFGAGVISGATVFGANEIGMIWLTIFIASIIGAVFCVVVMARSEWGKDDLPNFLLDDTPWSKVSEIEGIQFVAHQSDYMLLSSKERVEIQILVQNTLNVEREICFALKAPQRVSLNRAGLIYDKEPRISLGPAAVGRLKISVMSHPDAIGRYSLTLHPKVKGRPGKRLRKKRARSYSPPIGGWMTFVALFTGILVFGGGITFPIRVKHLNRTSFVPLEPPETETQILWTMDEHKGVEKQ